LTERDNQQTVNFAADDERVIRYLKGETLLTDTAYKGNVLVCVDGFGLGWAQGSGNGTLKNRYYPGWRYQ
jgi:NOL1/NOP2/fmu family ribosome biogenesis protein